MAEEEKLNLEVVSPEKLIMSKSVDMVSISGTEGDFGCASRSYSFSFKYKAWFT